MIPAAATTARPTATVPASGTAAKLIASTNADTMTTDMIPPRLSTGSVASLTWAGTNTTAMASATAASGKVIRKTEPHQKCSSKMPEASGPSAEIAPPRADHNAIDRVRPGPDHRAVINARVVGIGHARRHPARGAGARTSTPSFGRERREQARRDRQRHARGSA